MFGPLAQGLIFIGMLSVLDRPAVTPPSAEFITPSAASFPVSASLLVSMPLYTLFPSRTRVAVGTSQSILLALLLIGGVEPNPGPQRAPTNRPVRKLQFGLLNVRSAVNKAAEIHDIIESHHLDSLILTETWIDAGAPLAIKQDIAPIGFSVKHVHRTAIKGGRRGRISTGHGDAKRGGGLAVIYRDSLAIVDIKHSFSAHSSFESLCVKFSSSNKHINVIGIYRPPPAPDNIFFNEISNLLDAFDLLTDETIICGDFNCPGSSNVTIDTRLDQLIADRGLHQYVSSSTRKRNGNILDLVIARPSSVITAPVTSVEVSFSDHNLVTFAASVAARKACVDTFYFRDIKNIDKSRFMNIINQSSIVQNPPSSVDDFLTQFEIDVTGALDELAPRKQRTKRVATRPTASWLSVGSKELKKKARSLHRRFIATDSDDDYVKYRKAGRAAAKAIKSDRQEFYRREIANCSTVDQKSKWRMFNEILHTKDRVYTSSEDATKLAASFTQFFQDKLSTIAGNIQALLATSTCLLSNTPSPSQPSKLMSLTAVSVLEVNRLLQVIPDKSSPLDFIPTSLIRSCSSTFSPLIAKLANLSFSQGKFPSRFKIAQVTPLLKKPNLDPQLPSNYRPISNLNSLSKIMERLAMDRLRPHITSSQNFSRWQSAYRPGHSTESALLHITNTLARSAGKRRTSLVCAIDLSAAFDTISHATLIERLRTDFGVSGSAGMWLNTYLTGRHQFVRVGASSGRTTLTTSGVPQGSVLGPLLFSAYMSPVSRIIASHGVGQHHYADDTTLFVELSGPSDLPSTRLNNCLTDIVGWCLHNNMQINPDKTETMLVGSSVILKKFNNPRSLGVVESPKNTQTTVKIIGATLDSTLSFDHHITSVSQSCHFHMRALRHIRPMLSVASANQLACSIIASRLDYCNSLFFNTSAHNMMRLQRIQNTLARIVLRAPSRASAGPLLARLHWLPVDQRIKYKISCLAFKATVLHSPNYLCDILTMYNPPRTLRSTGGKLLSIPNIVSELAISKKAFSFTAPTVWNDLSFNTRSADTIDSFKHLLKTELFNIAFPSAPP